jgi:hypothetical protein
MLLFTKVLIACRQSYSQAGDAAYCRYAQITTLKNDARTSCMEERLELLADVQLWLAQALYQILS